MRPEDDERWPNCSFHSTKHWCDVTRQFMIDGNDHYLIEPGIRYCVPIVPTMDLYAEVSIDSEAVIPDSYGFGLVMFADPFSMEEEIQSLGLWTRGEGRLSMAASVNDWVEGYADDKCNAQSHSFEQEMHYQKMNGSLEIKANRWCLAYFKRCYPCIKELENKSTATQVVNFDATSFGVNPSEFRSGGSQTFNTNARQNRARDALRNRFGNRA